VLSDPASSATQGFLQLTSALVSRANPLLQQRILDSAHDANLLLRWCEVGATLCQTALTELVTTTGQTGDLWLDTLDNGSGPMACAQLLACAPDSAASRSLSDAINGDTRLQRDVVVALAQLCSAIAEHLARATCGNVNQVLHGVAESLGRSPRTGQS
jgi:hypothetical protein